MARTKKAYRLWKRGKRYYFNLPGMYPCHSTGYERKTDAENFVIEKLSEWEPPPAQALRGRTLRDFIKPYYD